MQLLNLCSISAATLQNDGEMDQTYKESNLSFSLSSVSSNPTPIIEEGFWENLQSQLNQAQDDETPEIIELFFSNSPQEESSHNSCEDEFGLSFSDSSLVTSSDSFDFYKELK